MSALKQRAKRFLEKHPEYPFSLAQVMELLQAADQEASDRMKAVDAWFSDELEGKQHAGQ